MGERHDRLRSLRGPSERAGVGAAVRLPGGAAGHRPQRLRRPVRPVPAARDGQAGPAGPLHPLPPRRLRLRLHQPGAGLRGAGIRGHLPAGHSLGAPGAARPDPAELGQRGAEGALAEAPGPGGEDRHLRPDRARRRQRRGGNPDHGPARRRPLRSQRRKDLDLAGRRGRPLPGVCLDRSRQEGTAGTTAA